MKKKKYEFDLNDIVAVVYVIAVVLTILKIDGAVLFVIGATMGLTLAIQAKRLNLILINVAFMVLNSYLIIAK